MADGSDLKAKGLKATLQAAMPKAAKDIDSKYDKLEKAGQLTSSPWAANLPWTNQGAASYKTPLALQKEKEAKEIKDALQKKKGAAPVKAAPVKKGAASVEAVEAPKKGFFGLF
jgi:hypothetical protein